MAQQQPDKKQPDDQAEQGAPASDIAVFGDIDTSNDYPPGTVFELADGTKVDMSQVPDYIGGKVKPEKPGKPPR